uniref:Transcription termination factor 2, mitochondrial n=1 Tax=Steinernema glaseri TaxID=37863 RepID=A0A1I7ZY32_9BILA
MDTVPPAFSEHLCCVLYTKGLRAAQALSGHYGITASYAYQNLASYASVVEGGIEKRAHLEYVCSSRKVRTLEEIEAVPKKFVHDVTINVKDVHSESVSRAIIRRFPYATHHFALNLPSINEAWIDFAHSLQRLGIIGIRVKLDDRAIHLFKKLVDSRKLTVLSLTEEGCKSNIMEVLKAVLCQNQFQKVVIEKYQNSPVVSKLLQFWSRNSEKLRGKSLVACGYCEGAVEQLEEFLLQRPSAKERSVSGIQEALKICSQEECKVIDKQYYNNMVVYRNRTCVHKFEEDDEGEIRRIYIYFKYNRGGQGQVACPFCPGQPPNGHEGRLRGATLRFKFA